MVKVDRAVESQRKADKLFGDAQLAGIQQLQRKSHSKDRRGREEAFDQDSRRQTDKKRAHQWIRLVKTFAAKQHEGTEPVREVKKKEQPELFDGCGAKVHGFQIITPIIVFERIAGLSAIHGKIGTISKKLLTKIARYAIIS